MIVAAADGSALGNPGPAGWAWYISDSQWRAGGWPVATNNQAELMAVIDLLQSVDRATPIHILSDSQYVVKAATEWMPGWKRRQWRKADKKPVLNKELLQVLDAELSEREVTFEWVRGHAGHPLNEKVDDLARAAATAFRDGRAPESGPGVGAQQPATVADSFDPSAPTVPAAGVNTASAAPTQQPDDSATLF